MAAADHRGEPARDFALVCSDRFQTWERQAGADHGPGVHGFPEHAGNAQRPSTTPARSSRSTRQWFGPYFDTEFEIAPSFFGWNGNECSGLVLLDDRVMRLPTAGRRYIDHLVTHETCHQWWWNRSAPTAMPRRSWTRGWSTASPRSALDAKYGRNGPLSPGPRG